ncbi:MAG: hypothetical protein WD847_11905 [Pirellulales bacterium]
MLTLNGYAVLDAFFSLLRLSAGLAMVGLGFVALRQYRVAATAEQRQAVDARFYLLFLLALVLLVLSLASWPLLYLLLDSLVARTPSAMCIYGVTRLGEGSEGPARFLPGLIALLQATKPALVFLAGAWLVLHKLNQRTPSGNLAPRVVGLMLVLALTAVVDASAEIAYVVTPKQEQMASTGCCTAALNDSPSRFIPLGSIGADYRQPLSTAYYLVHLGLAAALAPVALVKRRQPLRLLGPLLVLAVISAVVAWLFFVEIAAPKLLQLPYHRCPYDLFAQVPETIVAAGLFAAATFAVGWAALAGWLANTVEARPFLGQEVRNLLWLALLGYLGSVSMMSLELALVS